MGFSLHIQRVDGRQGDLPVADLAESLKMFDAIPWAEEISQWEQIPDEQKEDCRPLFQLFDDSGHSLHITAYSESMLAMAYNFPMPASPFGVSYDDDGYIGTDQYPRAKLQALFECFFISDTKAMLALLTPFLPIESDEGS
jgi:hypothetical protein